MREQAPMRTTRYCVRQCNSSPHTCEMAFMQLYVQRCAFASLTCTRRDSEYTYRRKVTHWALCSTTPASAPGSPPTLDSCWKQIDRGEKCERACAAIFAEHVARGPGRGHRPSGLGAAPARGRQHDDMPCGAYVVPSMCRAPCCGPLRHCDRSWHYHGHAHDDSCNNVVRAACTERLLLASIAAQPTGRLDLRGVGESAGRARRLVAGTRGSPATATVVTSVIHGT
jgi:hypothetical protein